MDSKAWWESKTIWFNVLSAGLEIAQMLSGAGVIPAGVATLVVNGVNIILRAITTQPVTLSQEKKP